MLELIMEKEDLDQKINIIIQHLENIDKNLNPSRYQLFVRGLWKAVGYLIGLILATVILTWLLNSLGVIDFLDTITTQLLDALNKVNK